MGGCKFFQSFPTLSRLTRCASTTTPRSGVFMTSARVEFFVHHNPVGFILVGYRSLQM